MDNERLQVLHQALVQTAAERQKLQDVIATNASEGTRLTTINDIYMRIYGGDTSTYATVAKLVQAALSMHMAVDVRLASRRSAAWYEALNSFQARLSLLSELLREAFDPLPTAKKAEYVRRLRFDAMLLSAKQLYEQGTTLERASRQQEMELDAWTDPATQDTLRGLSMACRQEMGAVLAWCDQARGFIKPPGVTPPVPDDAFMAQGRVIADEIVDKACGALPRYFDLLSLGRPLPPLVSPANDAARRLYDFQRVAVAEYGGVLPLAGATAAVFWTPDLTEAEIDRMRFLDPVKEALEEPKIKEIHARLYAKWIAQAADRYGVFEEANIGHAMKPLPYFIAETCEVFTEVRRAFGASQKARVLQPLPDFDVHLAALRKAIAAADALVHQFAGSPATDTTYTDLEAALRREQLQDFLFVVSKEKQVTLVLAHFELVVVDYGKTMMTPAQKAALDATLPGLKGAIETLTREYERQLDPALILIENEIAALNQRGNDPSLTIAEMDALRVDLAERRAAKLVRQQAAKQKKLDTIQALQAGPGGSPKPKKAGLVFKPPTGLPPGAGGPPPPPPAPAPPPSSLPPIQTIASAPVQNVVAVLTQQPMPVPVVPAAPVDSAIQGVSVAMIGLARGGVASTAGPAQLDVLTQYATDLESRVQVAALGADDSTLAKAGVLLATKIGDAPLADRFKDIVARDLDWIRHALVADHAALVQALFDAANEVTHLGPDCQWEKTVQIAVASFERVQTLVTAGAMNAVAATAIETIVQETARRLTCVEGILVAAAPQGHVHDIMLVIRQITVLVEAAGRLDTPGTYTADLIQQTTTTLNRILTARDQAHLGSNGALNDTILQALDQSIASFMLHSNHLDEVGDILSRLADDVKDRVAQNPAPYPHVARILNDGHHLSALQQEIEALDLTALFAESTLVRIRGDILIVDPSVPFRQDVLDFCDARLDMVRNGPAAAPGGVFPAPGTPPPGPDSWWNRLKRWFRLAPSPAVGAVLVPALVPVPPVPVAPAPAVPAPVPVLPPPAGGAPVPAIVAETRPLWLLGPGARDVDYDNHVRARIQDTVRTWYDPVPAEMLSA